MHHFDVQDMTCSHCAQTVEKAIKSVDAGAKVSVDLTSKAVMVDSTAAAELLLSAIRAAGYDGKPSRPDHLPPAAIRRFARMRVD